jgi:hypothetical protein
VSVHHGLAEVMTTRFVGDRCASNLGGHCRSGLRHFHRCRYSSSTAVVLLLEGLRSHKVLVIGEYGGYEDLRGSGRWSVIPYVHE